MKTFNSIFANANVKSIIAIAAVALTSVFGFTSCDKNDDAFVKPVNNPQPVVNVQDVTPASKPAVDTYLYTAATPSQLKYIDATYTLIVDGNKKVVKLSEMNEIKDAQRLSESRHLLQSYDAAPFEKEAITTFEFHVGNAKNVSIESVTYTLLSHNINECVQVFDGAQIKSANNLLGELSTKFYCINEGFEGFIETLNSRNK